MKHMMWMGVCLGWMVLAACAETTRTCAVLSFENGDGVGVGEAGMLANRVAAQLGEDKAYQVLPRFLVHRTLQGKGLNPAAADYATAAGKALDVPFVVTGRAGRDGEALHLKVSLIDAATGRSVAEADVTHNGAPDTFMRTAPIEAVRQLLGRAPEPVADLEPEPDTAPEPEPGPIPEPEASPIPPAESVAVSAPVQAPQPMPEPKPAPVPEPKAAPVPEPKPAPVPEPKPAPVPEPKPAPVPEPKAVQPIPVPAPVPVAQPAPIAAAPAPREPAAEPGAAGQMARDLGTGFSAAAARVRDAVLAPPVDMLEPLPWDSPAPVLEKIYRNLLRNRLEIGLRQTDFELDTTVKDGPDEEDRFLGTINQLNAETDSAFDKWFVRYYPIRWLGLELSTDTLRARTLTRDDGHSDGVFTADGDILTFMARASLGDMLRVVDWASNAFTWPGRTAYGWGDRFRVYYGVGNADFAVDFEEEYWWLLGYPDVEAWEAAGSPTTRNGGRRRSIDCTDESGDVTTLGFSVHLTRMVYLDFFTRDVELSTEATYTRSDATDGPIIRTVPLDNTVTGFGLGVIF
jgi:TolB-like protein